jgi:hypothetical protein
MIGSAAKSTEIPAGISSLSATPKVYHIHDVSGQTLNRASVSLSMYGTFIATYSNLFIPIIDIKAVFTSLRSGKSSVQHLISQL